MGGVDDGLKGDEYGWLGDVGFEVVGKDVEGFLDVGVVVLVEYEEEVGEGGEGDGEDDEGFVVVGVFDEDVGEDVVDGVFCYGWD